MGRRTPTRSALVVGLVILLGAAGTGLAAYALHTSSARWSRRAFDQKQKVVAAVVMAEIAQYAVTLDDLATAVAAQEQLTAPEFTASTAPFNQQRLPGAVEISYVVPATAATAAAVQAQWRSRGVTGLTLRPPVGPEHYYTVLDRSLTGGAGHIGAEVQTPAEAALRLARSSRTVSTSHTYLDPRLRTEFVMAAPVYATSPPSQAGRFRGWLTMTLRAHDFLGGLVGLIAGDDVSVALDDHVDGHLVPVATWQPAAGPNPSIAPRTIVIPASQRMWSLTIRPTESLVPTTEAWVDTAAATVGGLLTLLLAALTATVVTSRDRALRRVDQATAELRHDIERREAVEQQLRRREEELVGFAGVVAHDLRSPLATVTGHAELLSLTAADNLTAQQQHNLTRVCDSAARMQHLIDDLLGYATADNATLRLTDIDLDTLVDDILTERSATRLVLRSRLPTVTGDPTLIRQVLDNLIGNAIKYTPPGQIPELTITAPPAPAGGLCRIEVADRGIGVPDTQRSEIFNAFTRAEGSETYPGTGLGLAIVHRIVQRHGGTVGADPNPGGGTRFWLTLPEGAAAQLTQPPG